MSGQKIDTTAARGGLAAKLKSLRLQAGYTQGNIAEILHISRSTYTYYELGKTSPDIATLNRIAKLYCISVQEFLDDEPSKVTILYGPDVNRRPPKRTSPDPQKIGELTTGEKSIVAFLRDSGISPEDALELLKDHFSLRPKRRYY